MMHLSYLKKKRIWLLALAVGIGFYIVLFVIDTLLPEQQDIASAMAIAWISGWVLFWARQLWVQQEVLHTRSMRWQEAWQSIRSWMPNLGALPPATGFSIAPDAALHMLRELHARKPEVVMELGAGLSTYLMAALIQQEGLSTKILSIESDMAYLQQVEKELKAKGLDACVQLVHAPLEPIEVEGTTYPWYTLPETLPAIDMLIIDGPPERTGKIARYPAIPVLAGRLTPQALVIADDADRKDVRDCIALWNRNKEWTVQYHPLTREIATLSRHA
ncbi:MAG: hypothetical protein ABR95_01215 [Sphingobacteriales bacterium BACL12 MAG-120813-bin55]|jgi:predicted O-methyltransferase YrrM|nr:MAG: hypothetical protein ABR95_01215 [Sphingobacteriales bacterium BACL12 MAG-120813-bin55]